MSSRVASCFMTTIISSLLASPCRPPLRALTGRASLNSISLMRRRDAASAYLYERESSALLQAGHQVGTQDAGAADVDVRHFARRLLGVDVQQDAQAHAEAAGHVQLVRADERHFRPAHTPRGHGRKLGVEIRGRGEERAGHVVWIDAVALDHELQ